MKNTFESINWGEAWRDLQRYRNKPGAKEYWDKRSEHFHKRGKSNYTETFIDFLDADNFQTFFDIGCGTGDLAVAIAAKGKEVTAADFSDGMLEKLKENVAASSVKTVNPIKMSWEDSWGDFGIKEKSFDVAYASRSIMVEDLEEALLRLNSVAKKRVAVTLSAKGAPRLVDVLVQKIGRPNLAAYDTIYAMNILFQLGLFPELRHIKSDRVSKFSSKDEAIKILSEMVGEMSREEEKNLIAYIDSSLIFEDDGSEKPYSIHQKDENDWAFITWVPKDL